MRPHPSSLTALAAATAALFLAACDLGPPGVLQCGDASVTEGDNGFQLTQRCGQPNKVERAEGRPFATPVYDMAKNRHVIQYIPQPYEIWTYERGPGAPVVRVSVKDGLITRIELDDKAK